MRSQLDYENVKKPKGLLHGGISPNLVTEYADLLAIPLTEIYNNCLSKEIWPNGWLIETVTAIPKCSASSNYGELVSSFKFQSVFLAMNQS